VSEIDDAECKDARDWARLFIARNPDAHALEVLRVYGHAGLTSRLGPLGIADVEELQAAAGAAGLTPERLAARRTERVAGRAARQERNERWLTLSREELRSLPDRECARAAGFRVTRQPAGPAAPAAVRWAQAAIHAHGEICNGGFDQFFRNARPEEIESAVEGLRAIGAPDAASVVERAVAVAQRNEHMGISPPQEEGRDASFDALDRAYYAALPSRDPKVSFEARFAAFVRAHVDDF
jgi:hypothetical protein